MAIGNRVVRPLSGRTGTSATAVATHGSPYELAVAGISFLYATSESRPYVRQTAPFNKVQQDTEQEPGEQSLVGWWLRSQESFHKGSGVLYQEDRVSADPSARFRDSMGVDVWTPGQVTLLPAVEELHAEPDTRLLAQGSDGDTPIVFQASGSTLHRVTETGQTDVSWGGTTTILALELHSGSYYAVSADGIYKGSASGGAGTKVWTLAGAPGSCFYRRRGGSALFLSDGDVYDLTDESGSLPLTLPSATFSVIEPDWEWTAAVEAKADIRAAGISNGSSLIWTFTPVIAGGWTAAFAGGLPRGEQVRSLANYYNSFLAIGTNKGVRLASYLDDAQYTFGPVSWAIPEGGGPVRGLAVVGQFVYASAENALSDGTSGLVRLDPESELDPGHFAWANDLSSGQTGTTGDVADLNGRPVFCLSSVGTLIASSVAKVETGYLSTGRIRFRTLEDKLFKAVRLRVDPLEGVIAVDAITDADTTAAVATYSAQGITDLEEASLPLVLGPQEAMSLRFTFVRSTTDTNAGPTLRSYQIKSLPAPHRQRLFDFWVDCYDSETAKNGSRLGTVAQTRLEALEAVEESSDLVMYQDFGSGRSWLVQIDSMQFVQTSPPGSNTVGGRINLKLRTAG